VPLACRVAVTCANVTLDESGGDESVPRGERPAQQVGELAIDSRFFDRGGDRSGTVVDMTPEDFADLVHLRRARDLMDRDYAQPLDVPAMARTALMSPAHFSRKFRTAYGETPYSYLMTRRIERAKALLRQGKSITDTCAAVGCTSLGSFSSRFTEIVGVTPSQYRGRDHRDSEVVPSCVSMVASRPRRTTVTV
jgi:AraC-like DNA-binding protein